jgi:hypothetical protein
MSNIIPVHKEFIKAFAQSCYAQGFNEKQASAMLIMQLQKEAAHLKELAIKK